MMIMCENEIVAIKKNENVFSNIEDAIRLFV